MPDNLVNITINGKNIQAEKGLNVLKVCGQNGIHVPHYCYHPYLSVAGNCRMCLVKIEKIPKLAIACATIVSEGMVIDTEAPEVVKARESVMEFLLINHPLDCPVCDQAGECKLQNYSYTYGRSVGRFREEKVVKHTKDFGTHVKYWGTRCIVCTRCTRFTDEISGTKELAVFSRGDRSVIDIFPGSPINNPLSMNVVDICPVGALVSADFLYQARVWYMKQKNSICLECSIGCNTRIDSLDNEIKRIVPRKNDEVNQDFMCDYGRLSFSYVNHTHRIDSPLSDGKTISWKEGIDLFKKKMLYYTNNNNSSKLAFLVSAWNSNETLFLIKRAREQFLKESELFFYAKERKEDQIFPKFRISGDKNPNVNGIKIIFNVNNINDKPLKSLVEKIQKGDITGIVVLGGIPIGYTPKELNDNITKLNDIIVIDHTKSVLSEKASLTLPSLTFAEKSGSYINDQRRVQRIFPVIDPVTGGKPEDTILQEALITIKGKVLSTSGVFDQMQQLEAFKDMNYRSLKDSGLKIKD